jgi:hypothetical protein
MSSVRVVRLKVVDVYRICMAAHVLLQVSAHLATRISLIKYSVCVRVVISFVGLVSMARKRAAILARTATT